jgi:hypothetical protein
MKRYKFSPVTISREEYDDYIKARFLVQHLLNCIKIEGKDAEYITIEVEMVKSYFPEEVEKIRRMKNEESS